MTFRIFQSGHRRPQRPRLVFSMTRSGRHLGGSLSDNRHSDPGGIFLRKLPDGSRASRPLELLRGDRGRTGQRLDPKICMDLCSRLMNARDELGISLHFSRWPTSAVRAAAAWRSNGRSVRVGIVPLFQVYPVFVPLFSLHRSFPGLIGLLGVLPVGMLARILIWFLFARGIAPQRAERNCSSTGPDRS